MAGISFASNEVSELSLKYNKEYNNKEKHVEPELSKGSGSKDIDENERQRALKNLRDIINN